MVDNRTLPQGTFTRNLSDNTSSMAIPARADIPSGAGISTAIAGVSQGIKAGISIAANEAERDEQQFEAVILQDLEGFNSDVKTFKAGQAEGLQGLEQGTTSQLEFLTRQADQTNMLMMRYPDKAPEIAKLVEARYGYSPQEKLLSLQDKLNTESRAQARRTENSIIDEGIKGNIPIYTTPEGGFDTERMSSELIKFSAISANINNINKRNELLGAEQKSAIDNYVGGLSTSIFKISNNPELIAQEQNPNTKKFYNIINHLNQGKVVSAQDSAFANQYVEVIANNKLRAFEAQLGTPLTADNRAVLRDSFETSFSAPIKSLVEAGSSPELLKGVQADNNLAIELDRQAALSNPAARELISKKEIYGENLVITAYGAEGLRDSMDVFNKTVDFSNKQPEDFGATELKDSASLNKKFYENIVLKSDDKIKSQEQANLFANSIYSMVKPATNSLADVLTVAGTLANEKTLIKTLDYLNHPASATTKTQVASALNNNLAYLADYIANNKPELTSSVSIIQDKSTGVVFTKGSQVVGQPVPNLGAADKWLSAVNSYNYLASLQTKVSGVPVQPITNTMSDIQIGSLVNTEGGLTRGTDGSTLYYLPKNNIHAAFLNKTFKEGFFKETFVEPESTPELPNLNPQGGMMTQEPSSPVSGSGGIRVNPDGTVDELGNLIGEIMEQDVISGIIEREGGFVNDPVDRGGATKYGITQKTLSDYRGGKVSVDDVKSLSKEEASNIYKEKFLVEPKIDQLSPAIQTQVLDFAVNSGPTNAIKAIQKLAGVKADGIIGPATIEATKNLTNPQILKARLDFISNIVKKDSSQAKFLSGWINRAFEVAQL